MLRELYRGNANVPYDMDNYTHFEAVVSLTDMRLIKSVVNCDKVIDAKFSAKGYAYIHSNPRLSNPIDWSKVAIASITTALATSLALFIACTH